MGTFSENRCTSMTILGNHYLALTLAMWERQRESLCENENFMASFNRKCVFVVNIVDFSLEKLRFEAKTALRFKVTNYELGQKLQF